MILINDSSSIWYLYRVSDFRVFIPYQRFTSHVYSYAIRWQFLTYVSRVIYSHIQLIGFDSILWFFYNIDVRTKVVSYHNLWGYHVTEWRKNTFSKLYLNIGYRIFMFSYMNTSAWSLRNCYIQVLYIACSHITTASMFVYTMFAYHCVW